MLRRSWFIAVFVIASLPQLEAATVPVGFIERQVGNGLTSPTALAVAPDGRVFVTQQNGQVRIIKNDALLSAPFHTVDADFGDERGLLGVVADPDFVNNHYVYLYYTAKTPTTHNRIIRVTEANDLVVAGSTVAIHDFPTVPPGTKWHQGGALRFGADGKLWVAVGNHEDGKTTPSTAQDLTTAFGKIHRFNSDGTVPSDNPFFATTGAYRSIWMYGFRNPFTFAIQPATGTMFVNDVGEGSWEEVNRGQKGGNYGWSAVEGNGTNAAFINPAYTYSHSGACSVVGAAFYNPATIQFPAAYVGKYLFADFCGGWIRTLDPANNAVADFVTGLSYPVNLDVAPDGSLYYLARNQQTGNPTTGGGTVGRILYTGSQAPRITMQPQSQMVVAGEAVTFAVAAEGATGYQWQRNGANIAGATGTSYTISTTTTGDSGAAFRCLVSNAFGSVTSSEVILTVTTNRRPTVTITSPASGATYAPGQTVPFAASATDPEDGTLPASAYTWQIDFQHDTHAHPAMPSTSGIASGTFPIPAASDHVSANVWYRIYVAVRDSFGWVATAFRDIRPQTPVSDMTWVGTPTNGWGPVERDMSNGEQPAGDGRTITLDGVPYGKGLGVHAPSDVRYNLNGACSGHLVADVGIDDEASGGSVVFEVWTNGTRIWDSGVVTVADLRKPVDLGVSGVNELRLVVTDGGDGNGMDHADWAGAHVTGCGGGATPTPTATATATGTPRATATPTATTRPTATPTTGGTATVVNLSPAFNVNVAYTDGTTFASNGGIDGVGSAYSSTLLGSSLTWSGTTFNFGAANQLNGVRNATITLPAGQFATLMLLGTGVNGDQASQTVRVNYTDGTSSTFTQTFSNWLSASQSVAGQSIALTTAYRNKSTGVKDNRAFNLYGYSFALTSTKTVSSLVLPASNNVSILAATLRTVAVATPTATTRPTATTTATATATATTTPRATATPTTPAGLCAGVPAFATCTAYPNGSKVAFNNALYHSIADVPVTRDCPPNSPFDPASDNWWVNDGGC